MTDTYKIGDTVYGVKNVYINNDYYEMPIPASVFKTTVTKYRELSSSYIVELKNGKEYWMEKKETPRLYYNKQEALEALKRRREHFLKEYPNNWRKIIKTLNEILEEQGKC